VKRSGGLIVICIVIVVCFTIGAVVILLIVQRPLSEVIGLITLVVGPTLTALLAMARTDQNTVQIAELLAEQARNTGAPPTDQHGGRGDTGGEPQGGTR
jgi:uncharacterized membrane protein